MFVILNDSEGSASEKAQKGVVLLNVDVLLLSCRSFVALRMTKRFAILNGVKDLK